MLFRSMKTAFALAFLAAGAQATIADVTGEWKTKDHVADSTLQICASHSVATVSGAANTITYTYAGATCTAASTTATVAAELKWGSGATNQATAEGAVAEKTTCKINDTAKTVECNTVAVTAAHFSCVQLLKCRPTTQSNAAGTFKVKQSTTDTADVASAAATLFGTVANTVTITAPAAANAVTGAAAFELHLSLTAATAIASGQAVTVVAPGFKFLSGNICKIGTDAGAASSADSDGSVTFLATAASGTTAVDLKCDKVQVSATAVKAAGTFAVISGGTSLTVLTTVTNAGFVTGPAITAPQTGSASTVSLSAAALLLAASMYL